MGVLTQLREVNGPKYEQTVDRVSGFKKFVNPGLNEEKYFKIKEPLRMNEKYNSFFQIVDEVIPTKDGDITVYVTKLDATGKPRENLPHNVTSNAAANIEGSIRKKLEGREPDEDLNISVNSVWKIKGKKNPVSGEGYGDVMHEITLIYLDGNVIGQVLSGGTPQVQTNIQPQTQPNT